MNAIDLAQYLLLNDPNKVYFEAAVKEAARLLRMQARKIAMLEAECAALREQVK